MSAAVKTTPVPLHSSQSARALLHEIGPTCLIIETDHPGTWNKLVYDLTVAASAVNYVVGAPVLEKKNVDKLCVKVP